MICGKHRIFILLLLKMKPFGISLFFLIAAVAYKLMVEHLPLTLKKWSQTMT